MMTVFLAQATEEASESIAYKLGYGVGYVGANYFWEILMAFLVIIAASVYFFIRQSRKRSDDI